ncbi:MAG TPA: hypothetical protein VNT58_12565 [Gaiellaceae bacterium]|nr:hypothetical protein [Gaiellaceae bacterium]
MDAAAVETPKLRASERLLVHCAALDPDRRRPTAHARLEALLGRDLARRLVVALCSSR